MNNEARANPEAVRQEAGVSKRKVRKAPKPSLKAFTTFIPHITYRA